MSGLQQDWTKLPDDLFHSIVKLFTSSHDLYAIAATCRSWHAAVFNHLPKSTFCTLFPPLLLQPDHIPLPVFSYLDDPEHICYCRFTLTDLATQKTYLPCLIPQVTPAKTFHSFCFRGASFGHLIFSKNKLCLLVDLFTGNDVSPPRLRLRKRTELCYGALTAPLASPNSHLVVSTGSSTFFWRVGSDTWLELPPSNGAIKLIAVFKDQVFAMDRLILFKVHFMPHIQMQKVEVSLGDSTSELHLGVTWLVACGDMLLLVGCRDYFPSAGDAFEAYSLDMSSEPAKWVKVDRLENWAIFVSTDERTQPFSCMNPERWGGRSNCIYCCSYGSDNWTAFELGEPLLGGTSRSDFFISRGSVVHPIWVAPSMFSSRYDA